MGGHGRTSDSAKSTEVYFETHKQGSATGYTQYTPSIKKMIKDKVIDEEKFTRSKEDSKAEKRKQYYKNRKYGAKINKAGSQGSAPGDFKGDSGGGKRGRPSTGYAKKRKKD